MDFTVESGVIPWVDYEATNPTRAFAHHILGGGKNPFSEEWARDIITGRHLRFPTLSNITPKEEKKLKTDLVEHFRYVYTKGDLTSFLEHPCYLDPTITPDSFQPSLFIEMLTEKESTVGRYKVEKFQNRTRHMQRLSADDKRTMLDDSSCMHRSIHVTKSRGTSEGSSLCNWGDRGFDQYSISVTFAELVASVKQTTGKKRLNLLDLGGGSGHAVEDIKELYPEITTFNVTMDEVATPHYADYMVPAFIDRLPQALEGQIDLIISNMATRYVLFMDRAFEGCIRALSSGGQLQMGVSSCGHWNDNVRIAKKHMRKAYNVLQAAEARREIDLELELWEGVTDTLDPAAWLKITKH